MKAAATRPLKIALTKVCYAIQAHDFVMPDDPMLVSSGHPIIDELADLQQDQEDAGIASANLGGRRTRGVKIDFAGKKLPGEKEDAVDEDDDDEDAEVEEADTGKGKGKPVSKAGGSAKPASKASKPVSKAGGSGSKPASKA